MATSLRCSALHSNRPGNIDSILPDLAGPDLICSDKPANPSSNLLPSSVNAKELQRQADAERESLCTKLVGLLCWKMRELFSVEKPLCHLICSSTGGALSSVQLRSGRLSSCPLLCSVLCLLFFLAIE